MVQVDTKAMYVGVDEVQREWGLSRSSATEQDIARAARGIVQVREWLEKGKEHRHVRRR